MPSALVLPDRAEHTITTRFVLRYDGVMESTIVGRNLPMLVPPYFWTIHFTSFDDTCDDAAVMLGSCRVRPRSRLLSHCNTHASHSWRFDYARPSGGHLHVIRRGLTRVGIFHYVSGSVADRPLPVKSTIHFCFAPRLTTQVLTVLAWIQRTRIN